MPQAVGDDNEISLLDLAIVLAESKRLILGLPAVVAALAVGVSLLLPNVYTATTRILPPQSQSSAAAMLAQQLGSLASLAGGAAGLKNPNDLYVGMLKSRTVGDAMVDRFDLVGTYEQKLRSGALHLLQQNSIIVSGKDGIIAISVDDKDPKRAAEMANAYVEELFKLTRVLAVTEASQRRLFFERQLAEARDKLASAEASARQAMNAGGLVQVEGQGRAIVEAAARLRGQITVKEVQIGAMRTFAADRNPDLRLAQQELEAMRRELARLESSTGTRVVEASNGTGKAASAGGGSTAIALLRNVKYYETIYELLAKQFELAKIDEAKDAAVVQVLDKAIEPDRKSRPKRSVIVIVSTLAAAFLAVLWAFLARAWRNARSSPEQAPRLAYLSNTLRRF